jgi:predicted enzyme related to lactoylglutathione lyase
MLRRRVRRPDLTIGVMDLDLMARFFREIGWPVTVHATFAVVSTPGGRFGLELDEAPARLELALSVPDPLHVEELAAVVELVGGIVMEPTQETGFGGWGFSFNDPEGNTWEIGSPFTVTAIDARLTYGVRPVTGPIVALAVPRQRLPKTA